MRPPPPRTVYAVSEFNEILRALVEDSLPSVWVQGEISNFSRPSSGHWYFTLKDERAALRCAMFRSANYYVRPQPKDGQAVLVRGRASVYPARGELQLIVEHLEPAGTGALLLAFEALKNRLSAEGLFDAALKRPLPPCPRRIGLITSATGAAVHDVLTALQRRWPLAEVFFYPVPVQGSEAPAAIVRALAELPRRAPVELVLLVRGGGSIEDLWAFNDEGVARAVRACAVPVVCGVGHETDTSIADFVADLRAPTPTAAAELASPDIAQWAGRIEALRQSLDRCAVRRLEVQARDLQQLAARLARVHPGRRLRDRTQRLDELELRLQQAQLRRLRNLAAVLDPCRRRLFALRHRFAASVRQERLATLQRRLQAGTRLRLREERARLERAEALLASVSPQRVLERGYAIARDAQGHVLRDPVQLPQGAELELELARGTLRARRTR